MPRDDLDEILDNATDEEPEAPAKQAPQATRLAELGGDAELFTTPNGIPMASVTVNGRRETWPIKSSAFRGWLRRSFHAQTGKVAREQAIQDAVGALVGEALLSGMMYEVHVRVAAHEGAIYLDLADADRRVVEVTAGGWRIGTDPPVRFRRPKGIQPLPEPARGGSLDRLTRLLNGTAEVLLLVQAWLLSVFQPGGSRPILAIHGEQGSTKSSMARLLKLTIDPSSAPLRAEPRDIADLMIAAVNSHVIAWDNISHLPPWISDGLCRLSTGGGLSKRELYTDSDETILEARRPVILTGIEELVTRPDLLDRILLIYLPAIPEEQRRTEEDLARDFEAAHPEILGALLDAVATGLRNRPEVRLRSLPRMADFAVWIAACAPALGISPDSFLKVYAENRAGANSLALDSSPVSAAVLQLVKSGPFEGAAQDLLQQLELHW